VTRASDGAGGNSVETACPLRCRVRHGAAGSNPLSDQPPPPEQVDWAGLLVNLDMVFSQEKRDKVYAQHLRWQRGTQLWRWLQDRGQLCACDIAAGRGRRHSDDDSMFSR
jgi:hypothetical protein